MDFSMEKRLILCQGLDYLIEEKESQIAEIQQRTEQDYATAKSLEKYMVGGFLLEVAKERDVLKTRQAINELKELRESIGSRKNHLLLVPTFVQLHLKAD